MKICSEKDWKLFREKVSGWQEAYMERLNREYMELLTGDGAPSEKFRALKKRIYQDKKKKGVMIDIRRTKESPMRTPFALDGQPEYFQKSSRSASALVLWTVPAGCCGGA